MFAETSHNQKQLHDLENPCDQGRGFVGTPIYDVYDDELSTTLVYDNCREPHHKSDGTAHEGDTSSQDKVLSPIVIHKIHDMNRNTFLDGTTFTSQLGMRCHKDFADDVLDGEEFRDFHYYRDRLFSEEETRGYIHKVIKGARTSDITLHINYCLGETESPQHLLRKPPDRDPNTEHSYVSPFETQERRSIGSTYTKLLDETGTVLKLDHVHHDCLSKLSFMEKTCIGVQVHLS